MRVLASLSGGVDSAVAAASAVDATGCSPPRPAPWRGPGAPVGWHMRRQAGIESRNRHLNSRLPQ